MSAPGREGRKASRRARLHVVGECSRARVRRDRDGPARRQFVLRTPQRTMRESLRRRAKHERATAAPCLAAARPRAEPIFDGCVDGRAARARHFSFERAAWMYLLSGSVYFGARIDVWLGQHGHCRRLPWSLLSQQHAYVFRNFLGCANIRGPYTRKQALAARGARARRRRGERFPSNPNETTQKAAGDARGAPAARRRCPVPPAKCRTDALEGAQVCFEPAPPAKGTG